MLWESPADYSEKKSSIGTNSKTYEAPKELVIDGQQRLTALLSSLYGVPVKDKDFKERTIRIAFDPITHVLRMPMLLRTGIQSLSLLLATPLRQTKKTSSAASGRHLYAD